MKKNPVLPAILIARLASETACEQLPGTKVQQGAVVAGTFGAGGGYLLGAINEMPIPSARPSDGVL